MENRPGYAIIYKSEGKEMYYVLLNPLGRKDVMDKDISSIDENGSRVCASKLGLSYKEFNELRTSFPRKKIRYSDLERLDFNKNVSKTRTDK